MNRTLVNRTQVDRTAMDLSHRLKQVAPVVVVLIVITLLGYPVALLFGLPLALRDMQDLRKWQRATLTAQPVQDLAEPRRLTFPDAPEHGLLIKDDAPLPWEYMPTEDGVMLEHDPPEPLARWGGTLERVSEQVFRLPEGVEAGEPGQAVYVGNRLAVGATVPAREPPEGERVVFTFVNAAGPVIVNDRLLHEGEDYEDLGTQVRFEQAPAFGSTIRRVSGDYGLLDPAEGLIVFAEPPTQEVRIASSVVRLAEVLQGETNGENRRFRFAHERVVETDRDRLVFVDQAPLSDAPERPQERVDGVRQAFTFDSPQGIVTIEGARMTEGRDYTREGNVVTFAQPPARNATLRQYPDFYLVDPARGELELSRAPEPGSVVWTSRYTVYAQPTCGTTALACFYALPQHPVPFPHWIAARVRPFLEKYPLMDERNVVRATLYTTLGTLAALVLGSIVGVILAVLFVLLRPLERALLPWVIASQTIPIIALVPVLLLVLGNFGITIQTSLLPTAIIGAYIAFFPMVVGTVKGLRSVDPLALDLMRSYAATPFQVFTMVRFPAAVPFFFTSLKLATAAALVGALVAETESNNRRGLGFQILGQVQSGNVADVWILLVVSALLGVGLVALVGLLQRLIAPWERA
jgi:NitT/TauT family transport system permease protein